MGLRLLGASAAVLLAAYGAIRYRRGDLRRGEIFVIAAVAGALAFAAAAPDLYNPLLHALGFERGQEGRIIGLLVMSNILTFALLFRGFVRDDRLSKELGTLVDYLALKRLEGEGATHRSGTCTVVIPAHNEAENIPLVLGALPAKVAGMPVRPVVVADGCTDGTEAIARRLGAEVIRRDLRRGSGAAVRLGFEVALRRGGAVVVTLDADGQHDPGEMERLVAPLMAGDADMVQGSRVLGTFEAESSVRKLGVAVFGWLLTALARTKITDPSTGYRAMTAGALRRLDLKQDQFYVSEIILEATRKGLRVVEVPVVIRRRARGTTKKPAPLRYAWGFSKTIVRTWLR